ncbi:MAG TPA: phosphoribosylglycinamide formyltransferase 2, partial [Chromatiales bacterium]|nr:phosphoribosylglycinamide formyltransferase 2 [Chromatiales bacterium]
VEGESTDARFGNLAEALAEPDTQLRLFGKPELKGSRRLGVALALGEDVDEARAKARGVVEKIEVGF